MDWIAIADGFTVDRRIAGVAVLTGSAPAVDRHDRLDARVTARTRVMA